MAENAYTPSAEISARLLELVKCMDCQNTPTIMAMGILSGIFVGTAIRKGLTIDDLGIHGPLQTFLYANKNKLAILSTAVSSICTVLALNPSCEKYRLY